MTTATASVGAPIAIRDRRFFLGMAIAIALVVFVGFAPTDLFLVLSQPLRLVVSGTDTWLRIARWLTS